MHVEKHFSRQFSKFCSFCECNCFGRCNILFCALFNLVQLQAGGLLSEPEYSCIAPATAPQSLVRMDSLPFCFETSQKCKLMQLCKILTEAAVVSFGETSNSKYFSSARFYSSISDQAIRHCFGLSLRKICQPVVSFCKLGENKVLIYNSGGRLTTSYLPPQKECLLHLIPHSLPTSAYSQSNTQPTGAYQCLLILRS